MVIRDQRPILTGWDIRIEAIDINHSALQKAKEGRYSARSLRQVPKQVQERYFSTAGSLHAVIPSLKETVQFEERNLLDEDANFWQANSRDVIFCRNVIIYFSPLATQEVIARFERSLAPGGYLFLGHSETLRGISKAFELCHTNDTFYYKRRSADQPGMSVRSYPSLPLERAVSPGWEDSWSEVIGKASARIAQLTNHYIAGEKAAPAVQRPQGLQERTAVAATPLDQAQLALDLFRQERFADALKELERLPGAFETDCDAQLLRAAALTNQGLLAEAEAICTQVLHLDSLNPGAHYLRALCREHAGDRQAARQDAQAAVYLDRSFAMPHLQLGLMAKRSGDLETSRRELGSALGLLAREDPARILLFGGGFNREALTELCRSELRGLEKTLGTATRA
jgi:chemotaxis protein methyltransferase CheR